MIKIQGISCEACDSIHNIFFENHSFESVDTIMISGEAVVSFHVLDTMHCTEVLWNYKMPDSYTRIYKIAIDSVYLTHVTDSFEEQFLHDIIYVKYLIVGMCNRYRHPDIYWDINKEYIAEVEAGTGNQDIVLMNLYDDNKKFFIDKKSIIFCGYFEEGPSTIPFETLRAIYHTCIAN